MRQEEVEETFNQPFQGFNLGSTQYRISSSPTPRMRIFESPVVRLMKDEGYIDAFNKYVDDFNNPIPDSLVGGTERTLWVFRYYDPEAGMFGEQDRPTMETYAARLALFLDGIRKAYGGIGDFDVYLVAHSMGGLIARTYLQNESLFDHISEGKFRAGSGAIIPSLNPVRVAKLFTYGTPHRGISRHFLQIVQSMWWSVFAESSMRKYLSLGENDPAHTYIPRPHAPKWSNTFSLIGTNARDYDVAGGFSKIAAGQDSDGLVNTRNAYIRGGPRAFVHRAHSGNFGIVNSEEGYQNLSRFLFGDIRYAIRFNPGPFAPQAVGLDPDDRDSLVALDSLIFEFTLSIRGMPNEIQSRSVAQQSPLIAAVEHNEDTSDFRVVAADGYDDEKARSEVDANGTLTLARGWLRSDKLPPPRENVEEAEIDENDSFLSFALDLTIKPNFDEAGWWGARKRYPGDALFQRRLYLGVRHKMIWELKHTWAGHEEVFVRLELNPLNPAEWAFELELPDSLREIFPEGKFLITASMDDEVDPDDEALAARLLDLGADGAGFADR